MKKLALIALFAVTPILAEQTAPQSTPETKKVVRAVGQFLRSTAVLGMMGFCMDAALSLWLVYQQPNPNLVTIWPAIFGRTNNHNCTKGALLLGAIGGARYAAEILEELRLRPSPAQLQNKTQVAS